MKFDVNYARMLQAILYKSWRQHPTKQQLYGHLPLITKTIQVRRTRHAGHRDILLWTPSHGRLKAWWPARTYIQKLCADTRCSLEDLPGVMDDRDGLWERIRETWWWSSSLTSSYEVYCMYQNASCVQFPGYITFPSLLKNVASLYISFDLLRLGLYIYIYIYI